MKMKGVFFVVLALILSLIGPAFAQKCDYDPMERNLIFAEGEVEIAVPVDGFSLTFGFDIEKATFGDASRESNKIADKVSANIKEMGLSKIEIIKGWDIVRQGKIAIGAKGRRVSNRLVVRVNEYPAGKLHDLIAEIIDRAVAADSSIVLEGVSVFVSDEKENKNKEEVLTKALKALQSNAKSAAAALGRNLSHPKRIYLSSGEEIYKSEEPRTRNFYASDAFYAKKSFVSIQKSFKVQSEIVDSIKLTAKVYGIYQLE